MPEPRVATVRDAVTGEPLQGARWRILVARLQAWARARSDHNPPSFYEATRSGKKIFGIVKNPGAICFLAVHDLRSGRTRKLADTGCAAGALAVSRGTIGVGAHTTVGG